jgi:hypothetical protein
MRRSGLAGRRVIHSAEHLGEIVARGAIVEGLAATAIHHLVMGPIPDDGEIDHATHPLTDGQQAQWLFDRVARLAERAPQPTAEQVRTWASQARFGA